MEGRAALKSLLLLTLLRMARLEQDILRPELGLALMHKGALTMSSHVMTINFIIEFNHNDWPVIEVPDDVNTLCEGATSTVYTEQICNHQIPAIVNLVARYDNWIKEVSDLEGALLEMHVTRRGANKRFAAIAGAISGAAYVLGKGLSTLITMKRDRDMKEALKMLQSQQAKSQQTVISIQEQMAHYIRRDMQQMRATNEAISHVEKRLEETRDSIVKMISIWQNNTIKIERQVQVIPLLSKLNQIQNNLIITTIHDMPNIHRNLQEIIWGIGEAKRGILSPTLVPLEVLREALDNATNKLASWKPGYELVINNLIEIYDQARVLIKIVPEGAVLQIPLEVVKANEISMQLFKTLVSPVPLTADSNQASEISGLADYIAFNDEKMTTVSTEHLKQCHQMAARNLTVCPSVQALRPRTSPECEGRILADPIDLNQVKTVCEFAFKPINIWGIKIIETNSNLMLFGVKGDGQLWCEEKDVPDEIKLGNFAVLQKNMLCGCSLIGEGFYIKGATCEEKNQRITEVLNPTNPLTKLIVSQTGGDIMDTQGLGALGEDVTNMLWDAVRGWTPKGNLTVEGVEIINGIENFQRELQDSVIAQIQGQAPENTQMDTWFTAQDWPMALTFVLSGVGALGCLATMCLMCKQRQTATLVSAGMLGSIKPAYALGGQVCRDQATDLLIQAAGTLSLAMVALLAYRLVNWVVGKMINPIVPKLNGKLQHYMPRVSIVLELVSGSERAIIPVGRVNAIASEVTYLGTLKLRVRGFRGGSCQGALAVTYGDAISGVPRLICNTIQVPLPESITVPMVMCRKARRIAQQPHNLALYALDQYGIAHEIRSNNTPADFPSLQEFAI